MFLSFESAKEVVQTLQLKRQQDWQDWSKSGKRPLMIPSRPDEVYRNFGWTNWPDWLGYKAKKGHIKGQMLPFLEAREEVRGKMNPAMRTGPTTRTQRLFADRF